MMRFVGHNEVPSAGLPQRGMMRFPLLVSLSVAFLTISPLGGVNGVY